MRPWLTSLLALAACTQAPPPTSNATLTPEPIAAPTFPAARDYVGRWTGVEGMVLDIAATDRPDRYRLTMQYDLDNRQTVVARLNGRDLEFERDGRTRRLIPSDGWATGLKYLAGKKDCLTVAFGEGYCRD
jgi:hypothetical protein